MGNGYDLAKSGWITNKPEQNFTLKDIFKIGPSGNINQISDQAILIKCDDSKTKKSIFKRNFNYNF